MIQYRGLVASLLGLFIGYFVTSVFTWWTDPVPILFAAGFLLIGFFVGVRSKIDP